MPRYDVEAIKAMSTFASSQFEKLSDSAVGRYADHISNYLHEKRCLLKADAVNLPDDKQVTDVGVNALKTFITYANQSKKHRNQILRLLEAQTRSIFEWHGQAYKDYRLYAAFFTLLNMLLNEREADKDTVEFAIKIIDLMIRDSFLSKVLEKVPAYLNNALYEEIQRAIRAKQHQKIQQLTNATEREDTLIQANERCYHKTFLIKYPLVYRLLCTLMLPKVYNPQSIFGVSDEFTDTIRAVLKHYREVIIKRFDHYIEHEKLEDKLIALTSALNPRTGIGWLVHQAIPSVNSLLSPLALQYMGEYLELTNGDDQDLLRDTDLRKILICFYAQNKRYEEVVQVCLEENMKETDLNFLGDRHKSKVVKVWGPAEKSYLRARAEFLHLPPRPDEKRQRALDEISDKIHRL